MGNELGTMICETDRAAIIPVNVNNYEKEIQNTWKNQKEHLSREANTAYVDFKQIIPTLIDFSKEIEIHFGNVLEVMAGSCMSSKLFQKALINKYDKWIMTDIFKTVPECEALDALDAVIKYGEQSKTLVMICPPPSSEQQGAFPDKIDENTFTNNKYYAYADYFAVKRFIESTKKSEKKYILFFGELGLADGTVGMYQYMFNHPNLSLIYQKIAYNVVTIFGEAPKELFLFEINITN